MFIKYINHGVLLNSYIEGEKAITTHFNGFYYNTKVFDFYIFVNKEKVEENYISLSINDGGYRSSPYTTKAIKNFVSYVADWLYNDFGDKKTNNAMFYAYDCLKDLSNKYFKDFRKCDGKVFSELECNGRNYKGYFAFNY